MESEELLTTVRVRAVLEGEQALGRMRDELGRFTAGTGALAQGQRSGALAAREHAAAQHETSVAIHSTGQFVPDLTDRIKTMTAAGHGASFGFRMMKTSIAEMAFESIGAKGPLAHMAEGMLLFSAGSGVMIAVATGITIVARLIEAMNEKAEATKERMKEIAKAAKEIQDTPVTKAAQLLFGGGFDEKTGKEILGAKELLAQAERDTQAAKAELGRAKRLSTLTPEAKRQLVESGQAGVAELGTDVIAARITAAKKAVEEAVGAEEKLRHQVDALTTNMGKATGERLRQLQQERSEVAGIIKEREGQLSAELGSLVKLGQQRELSAAQADRVLQVQRDLLAAQTQQRKFAIDSSVAEEDSLKAELAILQSAKTVDQHRVEHVQAMLAARQELTKQLREQLELEKQMAEAEAVGSTTTRFSFTMPFRAPGFTPPEFGGRRPTFPQRHAFGNEFLPTGGYDTQGRISPEFLPPSRGFQPPQFGSSAGQGLFQKDQVEQANRTEQLHKLAQRMALQTANVTAKAFESMAMAAASGMGNVKASMISGLTQILQSMAQQKAAMGIAAGGGAGPWGWVAAGIGVAGALLGGLLGHKSQPVPVHVATIDPNAAASIQSPPEPAPVFVVQLIGSDGKEIVDLAQVELARRQQRDRVVRLPATLILPGVTSGR